MALPGPWFAQPALVGCHSSPCANRVFNWPAVITQNVTVHPLPELWEVQVLHHMQMSELVLGGKGLRCCCCCNRTNLRTNIEMCICLHHGCWCNHDSYLLCAFSKLVHAKVTAMVHNGLEHEKAEILHQISFVPVFLVFVFSPPQSLITEAQRWNLPMAVSLDSHWLEVRLYSETWNQRFCLGFIFCSEKEKLDKGLVRAQNWKLESLKKLFLCTYTLKIGCFPTSLCWCLRC